MATVPSSSPKRSIIFTLEHKQIFSGERRKTLLSRNDLGMESSSIYYADQETNLPFDPEGDITSSKAVCCAKILEKVVQDM